MNTSNLAAPVPTALEIKRGAALTRNGSFASPKMMAPYAASPFFGSAAIHRKVQHEAGDGGDVDRAHDRLRRLGASAHGLLADVRGCIETGDRVLRQQ